MWNLAPLMKLRNFPNPDPNKCLKESRNKLLVLTLSVDFIKVCYACCITVCWYTDTTFGRGFIFLFGISSLALFFVNLPVLFSYFEHGFEGNTISVLRVQNFKFI